MDLNSIFKVSLVGLFLAVCSSSISAQELTIKNLQDHTHNNIEKAVAEFFKTDYFEKEHNYTKEEDQEKGFFIVDTLNNLIRNMETTLDQIAKFDVERFNNDEKFTYNMCILYIKRKLEPCKKEHLKITTEMNEARTRIASDVHSATSTSQNIDNMPQYIAKIIASYLV